MGFPGGSVSKESACNAGDLGLIPGSGRSPGGEHGNLLQYSCLGNPHGQRSLAGCSPWGRKESDMTEQLSTERTCSRAHTHVYVQPNHFAIHLKLIQHCKSTTLQFENKACICLTLKPYTLLYIVHKNKDDYRTRSYSTSS